MTGWEMKKRLLFAPIDAVLETSELEVVSTLTPIETEAEEIYWTYLVMYVDEEDETSHHSEGEDDGSEGEDDGSEGEDAAGPSQVPLEMIDPRVVELVMSEIGKMEGRIQSRLDRIETKLDKLVELPASGKFQSTTSVPVDEPELGDQSESKSDDGEKAEEPGDGVDDDDGEKVEEAGDDVVDDDDGEQAEESGDDSVDDDEPGDGNFGSDDDMNTRVEAVAKSMAGVDPEGDLLPEEFLTPIKLDDAAGITTGGKTIVIDSDSLKGRGRRTKRKAHMLCSPFIDPSKRRKLPEVDAYDP